jgi:hypothetical protein
MLLKLSSCISNCLERATNAEERATQATDPAIRRDNELLARSWRHLARSYEYVESLERFLSESRNRPDVVPPEMPAILEEQPAPPRHKPIIRRPRVRQTISFKDRLLKSAREAREQAAQMPAGSARERLLEKARQSENAVNIDAWISSPGSPAPAGLDPLKKPRA